MKHVVVVRHSVFFTQGMIEFNNKDTFEGQFVRGEIQGVGTLNCVSGFRYEGQWQNGKVSTHLV